MKLFIYGGSGSGKSAYAEKRAAALNKNRIYIATMKENSEEDRLRIEKHRSQRREYFFRTIEKSVDINNSFSEYFDGVILIECISNLVANEMFRDEKIISEDEVVTKIINDLKRLFSKCTDAVVVSNNIFDDGNEYDESVISYINALGRINRALAEMADEVVEVVVGIPINIKS